jgi:hypothetical protein
MKNIKILIICFFALSGSLIGQTDFSNIDFLKYDKNAKCNKAEGNSKYSSIFFDGRRLMGNDLSTDSDKIILEQGMRGTFTVAPVIMNQGVATQGKAVPFRIAIKKKYMRSLWMYSDEVFEEVNFEDIMEECEVGDEIIFIMVNRDYFLQNYEVEVMWGC